MKRLPIGFRHTAGAPAGRLRAGQLTPRRKSAIGQFALRTYHGPPQVILGIRMGPRETRTGQPEDRLHPFRRNAAAQHLFGNPEIHNTPVGANETLPNLKAV